MTNGEVGGGGPPESTKAVAILILGILGIVVCAPLGIVALVMGGKERKEIAAGRVAPNPMVTVGWALGIVGTIFTVLAGIGILLGILLPLIVGGGRAASAGMILPLF